MLLAVGALFAGIFLLILSAVKFVEGASATAARLGLPPLLIGMVVIGFGSSMPEMVISAISSSQGNPGLALGNAFGSNITNIALILGVTAVISPIAVRSSVLQQEMLFLIGLTAIAMGLLFDGHLAFMDGVILLVLFVALVTWSIIKGLKFSQDAFADEVKAQLHEPLSLRQALVFLVGGLIVLVLSSRLLVWGGIEIAVFFGISDLIIGLTIVAVGTSLPELAAAITAVRKGEHDLALGNVIGSNMFNISVVVGIAALLAPTSIDPMLIQRDIPFLAGLTLVLFALCYGFRRGPQEITRWEGAVLLVAYVGYNILLLAMTISG